MENEISRSSGQFQVTTTPITLEGVRKLIPGDTALVEYAVYRRYDPKTRKFGKPRYVAYVVKNSGFRSGVPASESPKKIKPQKPPAPSPLISNGPTWAKLGQLISPSPPCGKF